MTVKKTSKGSKKQVQRSSKPHPTSLLAKLKADIPVEPAKVPKDTKLKKPFDKEAAMSLFGVGNSITDVCEILGSNYTTTWRAWNEWSQVNTTINAYVSRRATISKVNQELVDANITKFLIYLSDLDPKKLSEKDIGNTLAKLATVKQQLYAMERTEEGKATAPIQHFWNVIVNQGQDKLKDSLNTKIIDVDETVQVQTIIDVEPIEGTCNVA